MKNFKSHTSILVLLTLALAVFVSCTQAVNDSPTRIDAPSGLFWVETVSQSEVDAFASSKQETVAEITPPDVHEPAEPTRITFLAAGDNVIHPCIYIDARNRATAETRQYNFKPMYADVIDYITSFDLAFINQETLMGGDDLGLSGYPQFNSPQDLGRDLKDIGFDIVNIAHNHMCDKGEKGLLGTIDFFESEKMSGVTMIGGYRNEEDFDSIRTVEKNGVTISLLSYTYGTNGISLPSSSELVVPYINDNDIIRQCALAEDAGDITVVSIHWGEENVSTPTSEQKRIARLLAENGADVIIGHHPHVLQPIEWIEHEGGSTLCIYSLGNLVSAMMYWENMVGGFFSFEIVSDTNGTVTVENVKFVPTAFFYGPSYYNSHLYFLKDYPEDVAKNHCTGKKYGSPATPSDMTSYAKRIMGDYLRLDPDI